MKRKVQALLSGHSPLALQPVEPYGNPYNANMLVAAKAGPKAEGGPPVVLDTKTAIPQRDLAATVETSAAAILKGSRSFDLGLIDAARTSGTMRGASRLPDLARFDVMHEIFGHESITYPWLESLTFLE